MPSVAFQGLKTAKPTCFREWRDGNYIIRQAMHSRFYVPSLCSEIQVVEGGKIGRAHV